jgi:hypothetical protein
MADFIEVAGVDHVPPRSGRLFTVADKDIAVFNVDGTICAIADTMRSLPFPAKVGDGKIVVALRSNE